VDFVPLVAWQMKLVFAAMAWPTLAGLYPSRLRRGIANTRLIACPGYKVILGGPAWEKRFEALSFPWPDPVFTDEDFAFQVSAFWRNAIWVQKKIARGEVRAALRWDQREIVESLFILLAEEARIVGRPARPEARKAEQWLDARRLEQTKVSASLDRKSLARALLLQIDLFEEVTRSVAISRGFDVRDHTAIAAWLRSELAKILS
jgi:hypothetical protein